MTDDPQRLDLAAYALGVLETVAGSISSCEAPYFVAESALEGSVLLPVIVSKF